MAYIFTSHDAANCLNRIHALQNSYALVQNALTQITNSAWAQANTTARSGTLSKQAENALLTGNADCVPDGTLLMHLNRKILADIMQPHMIQMQRKLTDLAALAGVINQRTRVLSSFFASNAKKNDIDIAYSRARSLCAELEKELTYIQSDIQLIQNTNADYALREYNKDPQAFLYTYRALRTGAGSQSPLPTVSALIGRVDLINRQLAESAGIRQRRRKAVSDNADRLIARHAMDVLKGIPVEELSRDKSGVRVKLLKDNGYNTMADIYAATEQNLYSISGISPEAARSIKASAQNYINTIQAGMKLRLSTDDRSPEAEKLLDSLKTYATQKPLFEKLEGAKDMLSSGVNEAAGELALIGNGEEWLFKGKSEKQKTLEQYKLLDNLDRNGTLTAIENEYHAIARTNNAVRKSDAIWNDFAQVPVSYFNALEDIRPGILGNDDALYGLPEELALAVQEETVFPDGLKCELRRYQTWGVKYILHQEKVLLGDEMGLGKTVQAIAAMVSLRNCGQTHFMVVCPASVLTNWCKEIGKMSTLSPIRIHGQQRQAALTSWLKTGGVAVTTYETVGSLNLPENCHFGMLVVDEAHYIKNPETRRTINVKKLCGHTDRILFMTGTALENKVDEMISLVNILKPEVAAGLSKIAFMSSADQFRKQAANVYYRRKREDVLTELPELIESKEWCTLNAEEEKLYEEAVLNKRYADARRVSWIVDDLKNSSKATRMLEIIEEAANDDRKILVFSFFLDTIRKIRALLGEKCMKPINGSVPPAERQNIVDEFEKAPAGTVLCAQIQSGGTGLNIQSASVVIICEPQFKPSGENQAISRAYRMGQVRNVLVYRLLADETVDERITDILAEKQAIFDAFADKSEAAEATAKQEAELNETTFAEIIREEIDRINAKRGIPENTAAGTADAAPSQEQEQLNDIISYTDHETGETYTISEAAKGDERND